MDVDGEARAANAISASPEPSSIAALTGEIEQLVERLEAAWSSDQRVTRRDAAKLHGLRVLAEQLLS